MSAQGEDDLEIRLRQDVDTEGAKGAAGLKLMAGGFDAAAASGEKVSKLKMPPFAQQAREAATAFKQLKAAIDGAQASFAAAEKFRAGTRSSLEEVAMKAQREQRAKNTAERDKRSFADYLSKEKEHAGGPLPKALLPGADGPKASGFQSILQSVGRVFGPGAASGLMAGAVKVSEAAERLEPIMPALKVGAGLLSKGAGLLGSGVSMLGGVAAALLAAAVAAGGAVAKLAIAETQFKEGAVSSLDRVTKGHGSAAFALSLNLAKDLNIDREEAVKRVTSLLQLGFTKKQIPVVVEALADFGKVKGDEKANSLREKLEKIASQGKVTADSITGMAEAGVDVNGVIDRLKKNGESTAHVMARLKTEQVSAADAIAAITSEVESKVGGVARKSGQSIDGLVNAIKISFLDLFSDIDTGPLKGLLKNVKELLGGESGTKLKAGITDVGNALFALLKPFEGEEGKAKLSKLFDQGAAAAHDFAGAIRTIAPALELLGNGGALGGINAMIDTFNLFFPQVKQLLDMLRVVNAVTGTGPADDRSLMPSTGNNTAPAVANAAAAGADIDNGFAKGILDNASVVSDAVNTVLGGGIAAGNDKLQRHSPSKVFAGMGRDSAFGYALGMNDNADKAADAATGLASSAIGGAGGAGGAAASSGAGSLVINVNVTAGAGATQAEARAVGDAVGTAAHAAWERSMRRSQRDQRERSAA